MQIVIDIPDHLYSVIKNKECTNKNVLTKAVENGTPLPKGHWIPIYQGDEIIGYRCSECEFGNTFGKGIIGMNFCPSCGAKMSEVEE